MAKEFVVRPDLATQALVSPRLSFLGKVGTDLSTIGTWDRHLSRRTRVLVPVDVQAFVARADVPEPTVPLRGRDGDPAPFADGAPKPPGVHLHWAMPDALTAAHHDQATSSMSVPSLPDQWAVVRTLQPSGSRQVVATGWVVDARTATVTPLATFAGPATDLDAEALSPVRATSFGLMWTGSYAASENRFAFHDPLDDLDDVRTRLAPQGFAGEQAVYTVAGWWIDETQDPLDQARGPAGLDTALAGLGWRIDHDANDDDVAEPDKRSTLLAMDLGLKQPVENVAPRVFSQGSKVGGALRGVATEAGYPIQAAEKVWVGDALPTYHSLLHGSVLGVPVGSGDLPAADDRPAAEGLVLALGTDVDDVVAAFGAAGLGLGADARRLSEDMLAAFSMGSVNRLGTSDGLDPKGAKAAAVGAWKQVAFEESAELSMITARLATHSVLRGLPPSPVALTTWRQPWVPLWLEWQVTLTGHDSLRGWHLDGFDLETGNEAGDEPGGNIVSTTLLGRSPIGQGVGDALRAAVTTWLSAENSRAVTNGTDPFGTGAVIRELGNLDRPLDLVSASLDGIREQLLGLDFVGQVVRDDQGKVPATGDPTTLFGGTLRVDRLRLVDGFGRTLSPPDAALDAAAGTIELETDQPRKFRLRPRFQGSARWLLRLLDADQPPGTPLDTLREAYVDQVEPEAAPNPVAGFLLPDHIDESLEAFTVRGAPLGEIGHDEISGAVSWEPAPGREVRADAGPLVGIDAQDRLVAEVAAGLVRADAGARSNGRTDSALVNLLRAVDTTLWTVDTYAALGSGTVAALVGRPIAVVRASLTLDVADDLAEVTVTAAGGAAHRRARFDALADEEVEVKLGTLTRSDDALLGYFVDDDYEHLHLVDKVLAVRAMKTGRQVGQLGLLADATGAPDTTTLDHPYLVTDGILRVRPRQTTMLTLLMLPMGRVHLTSGVLPRKEIGLADSWFTPGMKKLMPSVRVGPLLVDPAEIRLPMVSLLGDKQTFTRRTGELSWKDDPILAASQTAYLPVLPHEAQEGWVRVTPQGGDQGDGHD